MTSKNFSFWAAESGQKVVFAFQMWNRKNLFFFYFTYFIIYIFVFVKTPSGIRNCLDLFRTPIRPIVLIHAKANYTVAAFPNGNTKNEPPSSLAFLRLRNLVICRLFLAEDGKKVKRFITHVHSKYFLHQTFVWWRCSCPFRKRSMPLSRRLEIFLTINKYLSIKLKKKENM